MLDQPENVIPLRAPTTDAEPVPLTPAQQAAQDVIDKQDYISMLRTNLPTLKSEYLAGAFLLAEMTKAGDVQRKKSQFIKSAKRIVGVLPPMTEIALKILAGQVKV